jgi:ubiquinone/menaquinone biosynthesis C-methylase UbiE
MRLLGSLQGVSIAEVPCGRGTALRALRRGQDVRYLACDEDSRMLARARRRARRRSLTHTEFHRAQLTNLPFADGEFDVFLCYGPVVEDGPAALAEIARCLRPGGRLIGAAFFSDIPRRGSWLFRLGARRGNPLPPGREHMYAWMRQAGLVEGTLGPDYGFAGFWARKPHPAP